MAIRLVTSLIMLAVSSLFALPAQAATVEGVALTEKGPVPGAVMRAYRTFADLRDNAHALISRPGPKPGQYRLELPAGRYYLTASGQGPDGEPLFAYHGLNPISIDDGYHWIPFLLQAAVPARCASGAPGIGGRVLYKGTPISHGSVSAYTLKDEPFRGMGLLTNSLGLDGSFWFDLAPGDYMVIARQRKDDTSIGPLKKGDLFCYPSANPITITPATACQVELECYPKNALESFLDKGANDHRGKRKETARLRASLKQTSMEEASRPAPGGMLAVIAGQVRDINGQPMPGLVVTAYPGDGLPLFQMYILRFRSDFSAKTDSQGLFRLEVRPGLYYLVARKLVGDAPNAGEPYGLYEGNANHSLRVEAGATQNGIDITVEPIMPDFPVSDHAPTAH